MQGCGYNELCNYELEGAISFLLPPRDKRVLLYTVAI